MIKSAPLPYPYDALEPYIDARTMEIHYSKHYQGYIDNFNNALTQYPELAKKPIETVLKELHAVPEEIRAIVQNNGGGYYNHRLFWDYMSPDGQREPGAELMGAIERDCGSYQNFIEEFNRTAKSRFGSGWAWLVMSPERTLKVMSTPNQDSPLMQGYIPLMGLDVWEHAYYLKYQNKRVDYIAAWWHVVNWAPADYLFELKS